MNKRAALIIFLSLFYLGAMCVYWLKLGFTIVPLREGIYLAAPLFAFIAGLFALQVFGLKTARSITMLCLTAGVGYWLMGELLFNYFEYIVHTTPYPSVADVFYTLGYPLFFVGLLNEIRLARINWKKVDKPILVLFMMIALILSLLAGYFGIYKAYNPEDSFLVNIVGISYGVGDLLLIFANIVLLILAWEFRGGKFARVFLTLCLSFIAVFVADILFAVYEDQYTEWFYKSLLDSFWIAGYVFFTYALCEFGFSVQDAYSKLLTPSPKKIKGAVIHKKSQST